MKQLCVLRFRIHIHMFKGLVFIYPFQKTAGQKRIFLTIYRTQLRPNGLKCPGFLSTHSIQTPEFIKVLVHVIITDQWNSSTRLYKIQVTVIYSPAIVVAVKSECSFKKKISAKPGLGHRQTVKIQIRRHITRSGPFSQPTLRDSRPTSAFSALISF